MNYIPDKNRNEWHNLLLGKINVKINSFVFKMRLDSLKKQINEGAVSIDKAIDEIYDLCIKYNKSDELSKDVKRIFSNKTISDNKQAEDNDILTKKLIQPKEKEFVDEELKKMQDEIQALQKKIVTDKKVMQDALENAVSQRTQVEQQLQKEKEVKSVFLKNTKSINKQTKNTTQEQIEDKSLHLHTNRLITENKINNPKKEVQKPKDKIKNQSNKRLKPSSNVSRDKKPFMKSLLDFLNE
jgi:myosin heavy subunit